MDFKRTLDAAVAHHQAGRLADAEKLYRTMAEGKAPVGNDARAYAEATHNLGLILAATNRLDEAIPLIERSIELRPREANYRKNFAATLISGGRASDNERAYVASKKALEMLPGDVTALNMFAHAATAAGHKREAAPAWQRLALAIPTDATFRFNAGCCFQEAGDDDAAISHYREALKLKPDYVEAITNLATLLTNKDRKPELMDLLNPAAAKNLLLPALYPLYASLLIEAGRIAEGKAILEIAERDFARAANDPPPKPLDFGRQIGGAVGEIGEMADSVRRLDEYSQRYPDDIGAFSGTVSRRQYLYPDDPASLLAHHRRFEAQFTAGITPLPPVPMTELSGRRLRVGYLSGDFRWHSVATFFEPLLTHHNPDRVDVHCFSTGEIVDEVTGRMKAAAHHWHDVTKLRDEPLAALIRQSQIDVLVDLSGHTGGSRLTLLAWKPAPVQLTYLGYSSTVGLSAIDGVITDAVADPPGNESHFVEKLYRLPSVFAVFSPIRDAPPIAEAPFRKAGHVTIGSVGPMLKINDGVLDAWCGGLRAAPDARFLMMGKFRDMPSFQQELRKRFAARGVDPARVEFLGQISFSDYLAAHGRLDMIVDTFPFTGHTTTVQNLWMGVPVITYAGLSHRNRMSASVLAAIGLEEFIANAESDFAPLIARWANDPEGLAARRTTMRERMLASPLMDAPRFARDFEDLLYRAYEDKRTTA